MAWLDWGCGNEEDRQRSLENQDRACASLLLRIRSPASNPDATATRARLNMLPPIRFSNHRPILMQWSIVQIVNGQCRIFPKVARGMLTKRDRILGMNFSNWSAQQRYDSLCGRVTIWNPGCMIPGCTAHVAMACSSHRDDN
jgi:hypothetical protein